MKFELSTAGTFYDTKRKERLEKLGFKFKTTAEVYGEHTFEEWYLDCLDDGEPTIEINSIEELMDFIKEYGSVVVDSNSITIYDDYLG